MNNLSPQQQAAYGRQRQIHDEMRERPTWIQRILRSAADDAGLDIVGYQHEIADEDGRLYWFDVAGRTNGELVLIDILDSYGSGGTNRQMKQIAKRKERLCRKLGVNYVKLKGGSKEELEIRISLKLMEIQDDK